MKRLSYKTFTISRLEIETLEFISLRVKDSFPALRIFLQKYSETKALSKAFDFCASSKEFKMQLNVSRDNTQNVIAMLLHSKLAKIEKVDINFHKVVIDVKGIEKLSKKKTYIAAKHLGLL